LAHRCRRSRRMNGSRTPCVASSPSTDTHNRDGHHEQPHCQHVLILNEPALEGSWPHTSSTTTSTGLHRHAGHRRRLTSRGPPPLPPVDPGGAALEIDRIVSRGDVISSTQLPTCAHLSLMQQSPFAYPAPDAPSRSWRVQASSATAGSSAVFALGRMG
jgi:hypothetical protein